jgi:hypothetical protein
MHREYLPLVDFDEMSKAYINATSLNLVEVLTEENFQLKKELNALNERYDRMLSTLQDSIETVLRVAREGKADN